MRFGEKGPSVVTASKNAEPLKSRTWALATGAPSIGRVQVTITPPAYSGRAPQTVIDPERIDAALAVAYGVPIDRVREVLLTAARRDLPVLDSPEAQVVVTALGAAYLAGLGAGVWSSMDEVAANWEVEARVMPTASRAAADSAYALWQRAVDRSRAWEPQD